MLSPIPCDNCSTSFLNRFTKRASVNSHPASSWLIHNGIQVLESSHFELSNLWVIARLAERLQGVTIALNSQVTGIRDNTLITTRGDISFDLAINCAGPFCDDIAAMAGLSDIEIRPCRGDYYVLNSCPVTRPVYQLPYHNAHGLNVHLTPTVDGQLLFGPNAFFIDEKTDYKHGSGVEEYARSAEFYLPGIDTSKLQSAYSGNRPKLFVEGKPLPEFLVKKSGNWIHLLGIESPGLTAAPALAKHVLDQI